jgi:VIT1/CCC1 family predicted Fe2+/Mn2+ transporter
MTRSDDTRRRPVLEPTDRIAEIVFGLIMATTFTGTLSATAGREDVRLMLIGAIGCNLAWGLVDAVMYVVTTLTERGRNLRFLQQVRATTQPAVAQRLIGDALPDALTRSLQPGEIDRFWARLQALPEPPRHPRLAGRDFAAATAVFLLVVASTFPVVVPFMVFDQVVTATRTSNAIAVLILFFAGHALGRHAGYLPWRTGLAMAAIGAVLVVVTIALGG